MAAKWQRWMPLEIDKIRGSMFFRALPAESKVGYLFLLMAAWETEDCTIPNDPAELAILSGLNEGWDEFGTRIMRKFTEVKAGRLRNEVLYSLWLDAQKRFIARSSGAKKMLSNREHHAQLTAASCSADTETGTGIETVKQKQKPSRRKTARGDDGLKHSSDPRHVACKERIFAAYRHKNNGANPDWDGREGRALGMLLSSQPELNEESINPLLLHWARSDINHSDRPSIWIPKLSSFRMYPVDRFGKPKDGKGALGGGNRQAKTSGNWEVLRNCLEELPSEDAYGTSRGETGGDNPADVGVVRPSPGEVRA